MDPVIINNFLPEDLFVRLLKYTSGRLMPWSYGSKSATDVDPHGHLAWKPVHDKPHNLADLSSMLRMHLLQRVWEFVVARYMNKLRYKLIRLYVNGYTYGMDGYAHTDSTRAGEITVIIYLCASWDPDWGGETLAWRGERIWVARPARNRAFLLPSNMLHRASSLTRKCNDVRTVLVLKLRPERSPQFEKLSSWLVEKGALYHDHGRGTLHDHLVRVYALLEDRDLDRQVCFGGGLHSIYGTNAFKQRLLTPAQHTRADVAGEFGREAEQMAYRFAMIDRPKELDLAAKWLQVEKWQAGQKFLLRCTHDSDIALSAIEVRPLCLIECANLADQGSLARWENLALLWR